MKKMLFFKSLSTTGGLLCAWFFSSGFIFLIDSCTAPAKQVEWRLNVGPVVSYQINTSSLSYLNLGAGTTANCSTEIQTAASNWTTQNLTTFQYNFLPTPSTDTWRGIDSFDQDCNPTRPIVQGNVFSDYTYINSSAEGVPTAFTLFTYCGDELKQFDIFIQPVLTYDCTDGPYPVNQYDLQATMTHEFGHALGLEHYSFGGSGYFQPDATYVSDHGDPPCIIDGVAAQFERSLSRRIVYA